MHVMGLYSGRPTSRHGERCELVTERVTPDVNSAGPGRFSNVRDGMFRHGSENYR